MNKFLEVGVTEKSLKKEIEDKIYDIYVAKIQEQIDKLGDNFDKKQVKSRNKYVIEKGEEINNKLTAKVDEYFNNEYTGIKLTYLNELYTDDSKGNKTKSTYYTVYKKHILNLEKASKKDLMKFTKSEIENMFNMSLTDSSAVKNSLWTFVNQYLTWCTAKSFIANNVCDLLEAAKLKKVRSKVLKDKYYSKEDIFNICHKAIEPKKKKNENGDEVVVYSSKQSVLPLLLARYGIVGKKLEDMINLKQDDVSCDNYTISVMNEDRTDIKYTVEVDAEFIEFYKSAIQETMTVKERDLYLSDYVLKSTKAGKISNATIYYNLVSVFEDLELERIAFLDLENSCKIELLREIELKNEKLTNEDFINIVKKFDEKAGDSTYYNLKTFYSTLYPEATIEDKKRVNSGNKTEETIYVRADRRLKGDDRARIPVAEYEDYLKKVKLQRLREKEGRED